jgi:DNA-binding MarR family transcriptional regulator
VQRVDEASGDAAPGPGGDAGQPPQSPQIPGLLVRRSQQAHTALWALCVQEDLTTPQYAILRVLLERGWTDQTTLGQLAALDRSNTAEVLVRLSKRELVQQRRDATDRRRNLWSLTEAGVELYRRVLPSTVVANELLLAPLDVQERRELMRLLGVVVTEAERRLQEMEADTAEARRQLDALVRAQGASGTG